MSDLLSRPLVPVANEDDAVTTYENLRPYLDPGVVPRFVTVIEKAGGGIDKASVEQREEVAREAFDAVRSLASDDGVGIDTEIVYATDVAEGIFQTADEHDASAIAFCSRGGGRLIELLSGRVRSALVEDSELPVVVLPTE